jgi:hypothetical protein
VRRWLLREADELAFDHFGPDAFPGVLQEVTVLSGRRGAGCTRVRVGDHVHAVTGDGPWTRYLLAPGPPRRRARLAGARASSPASR